MQKWLTFGSSGPQFIDRNNQIVKDLWDNYWCSSLSWITKSGFSWNNGSNMSVKINGAQSLILQKYNLCIFSPCGCQSLYIFGPDSAAICTDTYCYVFWQCAENLQSFFCSPICWEILTNNIGCSLHCLSGTRWKDRVDGVRLFAVHLAGI